MQTMRERIGTARERQPDIQWHVFERDYLLSWLLAGISAVSELRNALVFKGGTALKKCYFGDEYRFSEDLDFTALEGCPTGNDMERLVREAVSGAAGMMSEYEPVDLVCERLRVRVPHPGGQEAFIIRARFPWHRRPHTRVKAEFTIGETIMWPTERRRVLHEYGEPLEAEFQVYALEEIVAEKLRATLHQIDVLEARGWVNPRVRDYYDLWRVLGNYADRMELDDFVPQLREKYRDRGGVAFTGAEDFFNDGLLVRVEQAWEEALLGLVPNLPPFDTVIGELREQVESLVSQGA